ncbi:MAG: hypothetical protein IPO22_14560 [Anaerolineales bacterium]|nr:hypothetical protein [Anaerolineales bacterium]
MKLIEKAREQAQALFERDPELSQPEHALLAEAFESSLDRQRGCRSLEHKRTRSTQSF